ncbi:MAG TPA: hypothetical protein VJN62_07045 [Gemmatimonadales bacterium]|nr:hypothetical protein [Gemmatimonadales bacterium]
MRLSGLSAFALLAALQLPTAVSGQRTRKSVALSPLSLPQLLDSLPQVTVIDSLLTTELRAAGYDVLPPSDAGTLWKHLVDSADGLFSPITGALDSVKYRAVHEGVLRALLARHGAVYWLRDSIEISIVPWLGSADWDGQSERVGPSDRRGTVAALTLLISVEDPEGTVVATGRGGLQVLYKFEADSLSAVPREAIFADARHLRQGVRIALQTMVNSPGTAP